MNRADMNKNNMTRADMSQASLDQSTMNQVNLNQAALNRAGKCPGGAHRAGGHPVHRIRRSRGIGIVTAIFLLIVLSGIGAAVVTLSTSQRQAATVDLLGTRAYDAARSGIEYGLYQFLRNSSCANVNFTAPGALAAMTVTVTCVQASNAMTDGTTLTQTRITATACNQPANGACPNGAPGADYVQRVVQVVI